MPGSIRRAWRDRRGIAAVEFAFIAPLLIFMLCGTVELGHMIFARMVLEGATVEAARIATATIDSTESQRRAAMVASVRQAMANFPPIANGSINVSTVVYANFSSAYPETYDDANHNGVYDVGETYVDRNQNGRWDNATPKTGSTMGGPGDVVAITVRYPKRVLFAFVGRTLRLGDAINLTATTVVRNEAVTKNNS